MNRRRTRESQERSRARRRTALAAIGAVVGVVVLVGFMAVVNGAEHGPQGVGEPGAGPDLVAAAALRACPSPTGQQSPSADLPSDPLPCLGTGADVNLAALVGKPAVINVWGSWCPPCREELPWFAALDSAAGDRLQVIGVDVSDTKDSALSTLSSLGVHYPSVFDPEGKTRLSLQWTGGTPVTLLVRADGSIAYRIEGRVPDENTLRALVAENLGVTTPAV